MKYIRTKDIDCLITTGDQKEFIKDNYIVKEADILEDLCDCYSYDTETVRDFLVGRSWKLADKSRKIYGCIKTDKGLIYVAEINDKGELELL